MSAPRTFVEHDILALDAEHGIFYQSFEEFWDRRMEPMQFIPREAKGVFAALRQTLKDRAEEQWLLFAHQNPDGCGGQPQAGGLSSHSPEACFSTFEHICHE